MGNEAAYYDKMGIGIITGGSMQAIVQGLTTSIPGVMGGMISDEQGNMLAHSFPSFFDEDALRSVAALLADNIVGLEDATGGVRCLDMRYELGRVIIKPLPKVSLLLLCQPTVNINLLFISLNVAIKKLEKIAAAGGCMTPPVSPALDAPVAQPQVDARPQAEQGKAESGKRGGDGINAKNFLIGMP